MLRGRRPGLVPGVVCVLILAGAAGCGRGKVYPAGGKVVFPDGTPLVGGYVNTEPAGGDAKVSARGQIQPDGTFRLGTFADDDGAVEGEHRVLIVPPEDTVVDERKPRKPTVHDRYRRFETSGLTITVTRDKRKNDFTLTVHKPGPEPGR
jgi:hypothetical protein